MNERLLSLYTAAGELEMQEIRTDRAKRHWHRQCVRPWRPTYRLMSPPKR